VQGGPGTSVRRDHKIFQRGSQGKKMAKPGSSSRNWKEPGRRESARNRGQEDLKKEKGGLGHGHGGHPYSWTAGKAEPCKGREWQKTYPEVHDYPRGLFGGGRGHGVNRVRIFSNDLARPLLEKKTNKLRNETRREKSRNGEGVVLLASFCSRERSKMTVAGQKDRS